MSFGEGNLHERNAELERRNAELRELLAMAVDRIRAAEELTGMVFADARFAERAERALR